MTLPNGGAFKDAGPQAFIEHLFLVQALGFTNSAHSFNVASWSISVEMYTYLVFGLLSLIVSRSVRLTVFTLLTASSIFLLHYYNNEIGNFSFILQCFAGYFLGCLTAVIAKSDGISLPSIVGFVVLAGLIVFTHLADSPKFNVLIFFISAALILAVVLGREGVFRRMLRNHTLSHLGMISYSVYMSHTIVLWVCNIFVRVMMKRPEAVVHGVSYPQLSLPEALVANVIAVLITLALSTLVFNGWKTRCDRRAVSGFASFCRKVRVPHKKRNLWLARLSTNQKPEDATGDQYLIDRTY